MTIQTTINDAIADVATEVRSGVPLAAAVLNVAIDYDIKVTVLEARVARAFPNGVPSALPTLADQIATKVAAACARYGVPADRTFVAFLRTGEKITAVCRMGNDVVGIRHSDGSTMRYYPNAFNAASVALTEKMMAA